MAVNPETAALARRVLVPTDGSRCSVEAADYAARLAQLAGGAVTLLHVVEPLRVPQLYLGGDDTITQQQLRHELLESGRAILSLTRKSVDRAGVPVQTELLEGQPGEVIVEAAASGRYDLIVIGSRGAGPDRELLLGSVSAHVVHHADCPVLIVRGRGPCRPEPPRRP